MLRRADLVGAGRWRRSGRAQDALAAQSRLQRARARTAQQNTGQAERASNAPAASDDKGSSDERIERLRAAKERARRRARGEE